MWCWSPTTTGRCCATGPTQPISSGGFWRGQELARAGAKRFLLAHLSGENNTPSLARQEAVSALSAAGYQEGTGFWLDVAPVENQEGKSIIF